MNIVYIKSQESNFPDGPVGILSASARDTNLIPGPGRFHMPGRQKTAHAAQLLSLCSRARAPQQEEGPAQ